jgi:hypothetical protein
MSEKKMKALRKESKNPYHPLYNKALATQRSVYKELKRLYKSKEKN